MLNKLAISGIKHRLRDYSVLFSGLTISAAIFYMFMALATNKQFATSNTPFNSTPIIFGFGIVLLAIITFVYIIYANGFLMSMRQREYGMFMMLGARGSRIGRMIFMETLIIGSLATVLGVAIGVGLTAGLSQFLIHALYLKITHLNPFYLKAVIYTVAFFIVIFALAAMRNSIKLRNTNVLKLLNSEKAPTKIKKFGWWKFIQAILGVGLLATSYYIMFNIVKMASDLDPKMAFGILLTTVILGTYFVINSFFSLVIVLLKKNRRFSMKKLNNFTLSQLGFRISDYNRILALVSMLFALALGAITVGVEFKDAANKMFGENNSYYDVTVHNADAQQKRDIAKIDLKSSATYSYKTMDNGKKGKVIVFNKDQFKNHKLAVIEYNDEKNPNKSTTEYYDFAKGNEDARMVMEGSELWNVLVPFSMGSNEDSETVSKFVDTAQYAQIAGKSNEITMVKAKDFFKSLPAIKKVTNEEKKRYPVSPDTMNPSKYDTYIMVSGIFSGLEFMGVFLGIAFLAMLASCLMFKILSGAASDVKRYEMLHKMGVRSSLLSHSINKEIAVLFLVPGALGVLHVVMGLQLFKLMLPHPYSGIAIPFAGFFALYLIYYLVTTVLYKQIVLKK